MLCECVLEHNAMGVGDEAFDKPELVGVLLQFGDLDPIEPDCAVGPVDDQHGRLRRRQPRGQFISEIQLCRERADESIFGRHRPVKKR